MSLLKIKAIRKDGTIEADPGFGHHVSRIIEGMVRLANEQNCNVVVTVNGKELTVKPVPFQFSEILAQYDAP